MTPWNQFRAPEEEQGRLGGLFGGRFNRTAAQRLHFFTGGALRVPGLAVLCAVVAASVSSVLAAGWTAPATLGNRRASFVAAAGVDRKGDAAATWLQTDTVPYNVWVSTRKAGAIKFGRAAALSGVLIGNPYPLMARVDSLRDVFVVWQDLGSIYGVVRPARARTWPAAQLIASSVSLVNLTVDESGNATMLVGKGGAVQVIDRPSGGSWGVPQSIATSTFISAVGLAMADNGGAVVIWETYDRVGETSTNWVLHASRRVSFGSSWGPASDLSPPLVSPFNHAATVAMDPIGNAVIVAEKLGDTPTLTQSALTSPTGSDLWSAPQLVSTAGTTASYARVTVDGSGLATAAWADFTSGIGGVFVATGQIPANVWTTPVRISLPGVLAGDPHLDTNRAGNAAVTWQTIGGSGAVEASVRPGPSSPWGTPTTLSIDGSPALPWVDDAGRVLAVWNETSAGFGQATKTSTYLP